MNTKTLRISLICSLIAALCAVSTHRSSAQERAPGARALDPQTAAIEKALDTLTKVEFPANPLKDAIDYISEFHQIPILLDEPALSDVGIGPDQEFRLVISDITLRNALELLLDNVGGVQLDYVIEHQVLMITTREKADQTLNTRVYNVRMLENAGLDSFSLANVIRKSIEPASWAHIEIVPDPRADGMGEMMGMAPGGLGGGGGLGAMQIDRAQSSGVGTIEALTGCLVVTQSQRVHRAVVDLLAQLREQVEQPSGLRGPGTDGGGLSNDAGGTPTYRDPFYRAPGATGLSPTSGAAGIGSGAAPPNN